MSKSRKEYDKILKNYRYFTCHWYDVDISKKPISKVLIWYQYIDIGDMSTIFSIYRLTSDALGRWMFDHLML